MDRGWFGGGLGVVRGWFGGGSGVARGDSGVICWAVAIAGAFFRRNVKVDGFSAGCIAFL